MVNGEFFSHSPFTIYHLPLKKMLGFNIRNELLYRLYFVFGIVLVLAFAIFAKMTTLATTQRGYWMEKAKKNYLKYVDVEADRGNIIASDGSLLATSLPFFDLHFDFAAEGMSNETWEANRDSLAMCLATVYNKDWTAGGWRYVLDSLRQDAKANRYWSLKKEATFAEMQYVKNFPLFRLGRFKGGLIVEQHGKRFYPFKILAHRTLGYVREGAQPVGIEGQFDNVLGGARGQRLMMRVPGDVYIPVNDLTEIEPKSGDDIVTTLDVNIQDAAENALLRACENHDADHGTAIVMEVKTGKVVAISNIGRTGADDVDENGRVKTGWWETYNYGIGTLVEPGSMFKLASFMAMIEDGFLTDFDQKIPVYKGKTKIWDQELIDAEPHGMDTMTVRQVFEKSSNVGTATLIQRFYGEKKQAGKFIQHLKNFGLDLPTGIEVGGEEKPYIKEAYSAKDDWSGTTLPWMSIGYELALTPLQLLTFYNAVANDGREMRPYIVERVERYGSTVRDYVPFVVKKSIASKNTIRMARELLEGVVARGTARNIFTDDYRIAGKTGTAQIGYQKVRAVHGVKHQAGFCGFFPAEKPIYSCIVVIAEPKRGGYHGAEVAAPVFREIADRCFSMKGKLHPAMNKSEIVPTKGGGLPTAKLPHADAGSEKDLKFLLKYFNMPWFDQTTTDEDGFLFFGKKEPEGGDWSVLVSKNDSLSMRTRIQNLKIVPSVQGMGLKDAVYILENRGCRVRYSGVGKVARQSISPGSRASGQIVTIYLE
jgi:cell division protein FtsI (penicillin-binding protein 3)